MDVARLRSLIEGVLADLYQRNRHEDLPALCESLRLPPPPSQEEHTKHQRLTASLRACPDAGLDAVGQAILDSQPLPAWERNQLQDVPGCSRVCLTRYS